MLSSVAYLVHLCGLDMGLNLLLGQFLVAGLDIQYPVKSFAPNLGGCRGSLRKFLQEINMHNLFKCF